MELAIISGKGGTGKSSITAAFATMAEKVVVADCDVDAANLYLLFQPAREKEVIYIGGYKAVIDTALCTKCGLCESYCRFDAIKEKEGRMIVSEIACDGCYLCAHICPAKAITMANCDKSRMYSGSFRNGAMVYGRLAPGEENSGKLVNMVRSEAQLVASQKVLNNIILDGPPGIGCPVISTVTGVDRIVIVTEPTVSGLSDLVRVHAVVRKFTCEVGVIINKHDLNPDMSARIEVWCGENGSRVLGLLPFEPKMTEAMVQGKSIIEMYPGSEISRLLSGIWNNIKNYKKNE